MRFGFILPHNWGLADPQDVVGIATSAEQLGFDSVWVNHHVFNVGFVLDRLGSRPYYDSLTILTYVAAVTKTVRLGTSVLVLPYLNPIVLAKALATLDVLSGGRTVVGVGVGALRQESEALGSDFAKRGVYTDEGIKILKELWTQEDPSYAGRFYTFSGVKFSPKPAQKPHPPIWVGGQSPGALRRVARLGDGWHPTGLSPEELAGRIEYLRPEVDAAGRSMSEVAVCVRNELEVLGSTQTRQQGPMVGTPSQLLRAIEAYAGLGVSEMIFSVSTPDVNRIRGTMETFAAKVMPRARG